MFTIILKSNDSYAIMSEIILWGGRRVSLEFSSLNILVSSCLCIEYNRITNTLESLFFQCWQAQCTEQYVLCLFTYWWSTQTWKRKLKECVIKFNSFGHGTISLAIKTCMEQSTVKRTEFFAWIWKWNINQGVKNINPAYRESFMKQWRGTEQAAGGVCGEPHWHGQENG